MTVCAFPGRAASLETEAILLQGPADDLGAIQLVTGESERIGTFLLSYLGSEVNDWVQEQLSAASPEGLEERCRAFDNAVAFVYGVPSSVPGDALMLNVAITALDWPNKRCERMLLDAGQHKAELLGLTIGFTVGDGWSMVANEFTPSTVSLVWGHSAVNIGRYSGQVVADRCTEPVRIEFRSTVNDLATWLSAYPGLAVDEGSPITVDGLPARVLDTEVRELAKCPADKNPMGVLWILSLRADVADPMVGWHVVANGDRQRVVPVDHPDSPLIVTIVARDPTSSALLQELIEVSEPVIRSLTFGD